MQASQIPVKFQVPFANAAGPGYVRPIPVASQIAVTPGAASLNDGFPPLTFVPVGSGGIPPFGEDFNGILNMITQWVQWGNAGGTVPFDATFATEIGGYPAGALVLAATGDAFWLCTADNNTANPDTGGVGWMPIVVKPSTSNPKIHGTAAPGTSLKYAREDHVHPAEWCGASSGTANAQIIAPPPTLGAVVVGVSLQFLAGATLSNTGAATLTVTGIGTFALRRKSPTGPLALTGGEIVAGNTVTVRCDGTYLQLEAVTQGTAGMQNASSVTGTLAAVSGAIVSGNIPIFGDTAGTVADSGATPASLRGSADTVPYMLGLAA